MIAMPDPALSLALDLNNALRDAGIISSGATTSRIIELGKGKAPKASTVLDLYSSPDLSNVVYWLNQKSLNLYAENILKTIALKQGKKATTENGVEEVQQFWSKKLNIDANALAVLDGSGLSPENRITTSVMASILRSAVNEPWYKAFYDSLPIYNEMKMKSGSIRNVLAYTGYQKSASGTPYVFTFISNNYSGSTSAIKQKMFKVLDRLK
jgi:D-alanyl-D-alanine carboxypeptidase/D-alanyl-D-alanine-endopeptidase (penicillin-binding protein 4)